MSVKPLNSISSRPVFEVYESSCCFPCLGRREIHETDDVCVSSKGKVKKNNSTKIKEIEKKNDESYKRIFEISYKVISKWVKMIQLHRAEIRKSILSEYSNSPFLIQTAADIKKLQRYRFNIKLERNLKKTENQILTKHDIDLINTLLNEIRKELSKFWG